MTAGFNFLEQSELPAPRVDAAAARDVLSRHWGIDAALEPLGSQQDQNFLVRGDDGAVHGVLKIANPAFTETELAAQDLAAQRIAEAEPGLRVAVPIPNTAGETCTAVPGLLDGATAHVRLLRYLDGGTLLQTGYLAPTAVAALGEVAARVSRALHGFTHPGLDRVLQWDPRYGHEVVRRLAGHVADAGRRDRVRTAAERARAHIAAVADELPTQAVHLDLTDANTVVTRGAGGSVAPDGIIDFGDLTHSWAVGELAVAMSSVLQHPGAEPASVLDGIRAFHALRPLSVAEARALWPVLVLRTAVLIVSGAQQAAIDPDNAYVTAQAAGEWRMFEQATSVPVEVMTAAILAELGLAESPAPVRADTPLVAGLTADSVATLDFSTTSELLDGAFVPGGWLPEDFEDRAARDALAGGARLAVTPFGRPWLTRAPAISAEFPASVPTGISGWAAAATELAAPWAGEVVAADADAVTLRGGDLLLTLRGVRPHAAAGPVAAGAVLAEAQPHRRFEVTVRPADGPELPAFVAAPLAAGWLACARDPRPLLGLAQLPAELDPHQLLDRRERAFATVQEFYYRNPPRIERGWRHFMFSTQGRSYVDMINNVTVLGHAHPRVAEAAARQLRRLNTNSRFNYAAVVEYSERIASLLPDPLDTVFLVNSGSEAGDLALRLAMAATGRRDIVAVREAYHGWTYGTDAVSTSIADNPNALTTRPEWVHTVESPNSFRGKYRGAEAAKYAPEAVARIEQLIASGRAPAGFICETVYGNAGGMALPDGYLQQVYAAIRAGGGLCIADEVQVGYGRLGNWFWGFQQQGVVPDIVTVAKATGNGYPLGVVVTTRAVAEAFRSQGYFFSSTGGSPLSCAIGMAVLDVLEDEQLQANAARVGAHLKGRLEQLAERHPIIGTVHGVGLYIGPELVRDRETLEPATEETAAICERMLELGVLIQPTGDHQNILKTKPPLCIDIAAADFYVDMLDRVLSEGW